MEALGIYSFLKVVLDSLGGVFSFIRESFNWLSIIFSEIPLIITSAFSHCPYFVQYGFYMVVMFIVCLLIIKLVSLICSLIL